ncbi:hypothetical protein HN604_01335 [archaeon]|jgi:hypothetical protein|nr:hypothetical protein [archaeon]MBT6182647.1 hypothetical protein [archaeon]MBT6606313.1 hypothetical protein [archaeon]MBT7251518.1 hypothetical protein [archaeon]MBT7660707.1 hypothetical protein [archaeon]
MGTSENLLGVPGYVGKPFENHFKGHGCDIFLKANRVIAGNSDYLKIEGDYEHVCSGILTLDAIPEVEGFYLRYPFDSNGCLREVARLDELESLAHTPSLIYVEVHGPVGEEAVIPLVLYPHEPVLATAIDSNRLPGVVARFEEEIYRVGKDHHEG